MYNVIKLLHHYGAYVALALGLVYLVYLLIQFLTSQRVPNGLRKVSFFTTLAFHFQLVLGLILWLLFKKVPVPKDHMYVMIVAVICMTIANMLVKKSRKLGVITFILGLIAVVLMFYRTPQYFIDNLLNLNFG